MARPARSVVRTTRRRILGAVAVAAVAAVALAAQGCADAVAPNAVGVWGGQHVRLEITNIGVGASPAGGGTVEFDCAHGTITLPVLADKSGRFDVPGFYVQEHGGPIRVDEQLAARPARYAGEINGSRMTLTVTRTDSAWSAGPFTLQRGSTGSVFKCL